MLLIKVVDIPATATAEQVETALNEPYGAGYYLEKLIVSGLPTGIGTRAFFKRRMTHTRRSVA